MSDRFYGTMSRKRTKTGVTYESFTKEIFKEIEGIERAVLKEAATHIRNKMRKKVSRRGLSKAGSPPGLRTGNLRKGIKYEIQDRDSALVGIGPPAQHAHLLEFGTVPRNTKKGADRGRVLKRPFVLPTFEEESDAVRAIMEGGFSRL